MMKNFSGGLSPRVGVVLPVYHQQRRYIDECLDSVAAQRFRNFKLVIVIDGANDSTVVAVKHAARRLTVPFEILHRRDNRGIAFSLNEGFARLSDCDYFTWLSSDNRYQSDFLSTLVEALESSPANTVLAYSLFYLINEGGARLKPPGPEKVSFMQRPKEDIFQHSFIGPSFLFKSAAYFQAGGYNPRYEKVEDHEFYMRVLQLGDIKFVPVILMEYRLGGKYAYTTNSTREEIMNKSALAGIETRRQRGDLPKVSVLMPVYNQGRYIAQAIGSVLGQTFPSFHLVIVDDGSTDQTWHEINKIFDARIIPLCLLKNRGQAAAQNFGLKFALGEYILELDGDDWLEPHALETLVREMDRQPANVGLVYANRRLWFEDDLGLRQGPVIPGTKYRDKYEVLEKLQTHCPRLYRKAALEVVGGWRERVYDQRLMPQDFDLLLRLAESFQFCWVDQTLYHQRRHTANSTVLEAEQCHSQLKYVVKEALKRWGSLYEPIFHMEGAFLKKVQLVEPAQQGVAQNEELISRQKKNISQRM